MVSLGQATKSDDSGSEHCANCRPDEGNWNSYDGTDCRAGCHLLSQI
jgi:hypothetical protein